MNPKASLKFSNSKRFAIASRPGSWSFQPRAFSSSSAAARPAASKAWALVAKSAARGRRASWATAARSIDVRVGVLMAGAGTTIVPAVPEAAAIYGAVGTAVPVDDEDQYRRLQCMTCLMGDCYERMRTPQEWLEANGVAGDVAATYVTGIFKTILTDAAGAGPETLGHLVAEQTPGGMNEMVISEQPDGAYGPRAQPPAWGAVELAGASAWELALWRRRDDASDGAGPAFVAYAYAKRPSDWAAFRAAFVALARERGYVSEFVRFSLFPHFATAHGRRRWRRDATRRDDRRGPPGGADGRGAARPSSTGTVRKARKRGVAVAMSVVETAADAACSATYEETMDRRAPRFYYFDEAYYAALVAEVPRGDCYYATATAPDGSLVRGDLPPPRRRAPLPPSAHVAKRGAVEFAPRSRWAPDVRSSAAGGFAGAAELAAAADLGRDGELEGFATATASVAASRREVIAR
ncbi:pyrroline-5-carboxylate reductase [Aureococcus anophagefferens]|nr:pyrroline-5-carboxylate reductase [Aureococcus anophagefferens]